jgi:hypothetical protein
VEPERKRQHVDPDAVAGGKGSGKEVNRRGGESISSSGEEEESEGGGGADAGPAQRSWLAPYIKVCA